MKLQRNQYKELKKRKLLPAKIYFRPIRAKMYMLAM